MSEITNALAWPLNNWQFALVAAAFVVILILFLFPAASKSTDLPLSFSSTGS